MEPIMRYREYFNRTWSYRSNGPGIEIPMVLLPKEWSLLFTPDKKPVVTGGEGNQLPFGRKGGLGIWRADWPLSRSPGGRSPYSNQGTQRIYFSPEDFSATRSMFLSLDICTWIENRWIFARFGLRDPKCLTIIISWEHSCFSGGLDSTVLATQMKQEAKETRLLSIDYGQRHAKELDHSQKLQII